jgi:uncharacterized protein
MPTAVVVDFAAEPIVGTRPRTPGKWRAFADQARPFKTGDAFLIPNGFHGHRGVLETTTKHFVIRRHAAATEDTRR